METLAHRFIDAFNRRDVDGLLALADADIEFHPTTLVRGRRVYHGHDGLRRWMSELRSSGLEHRVRVLHVRVLDDASFLLVSEVLGGNNAATPSAMIARLTEHGKIAEARAYLSDEQLLIQLGLVPADDPPASARGVAEQSLPGADRRTPRRGVDAKA